MSLRSPLSQWSQKPVWDRVGVVLVTLILAGGLDVLLRGLALGDGYELNGLDGLYTYDGIDRLCKLIVTIACFWWISEAPRRKADADLSGLRLIQAIEGEMRVRERGKLIEKVLAKGVDLGGTDLRMANLQGLDLKEAGFRRANLKGADLRKADLRSADLSGSNLESAQFLEARLRKAQLRNAYLASANLKSSDMKNAVLDGAYLGGADFTGVRNLTVEQLKGARWMHGDPPIGLPDEIASFVRDRFIRTVGNWVRYAG